MKSSKEQQGVQLPLNWTHPDLQRLRADFNASEVQQRMSDLQRLHHQIGAQLHHLEKATAAKQCRLSQLQAELQQLEKDVASSEGLVEETQRVYNGVRNQLYYQKSVTQLSSSPSTPSKKRSHSIVPLLKRRRADGAASSSAPHPVADVVGFFDSWLFPYPVAGCCGSAAAAEAFLKRFAPLYQWNEAEQLVKPPFFFDEPCLMESSGSAETSRPLTCGNAACAYWHLNQLGHVRAAAEHFIDSISNYTASDATLCSVAMALEQFGRYLRLADSISSICSLVCYTLQLFVALGWHLSFASAASPPSPWATPVLASHVAKQLSPDMVELLCNERERERWQAVYAAGAAEAGAIFAKEPDALSWRCLMAVTTDRQLRRWLGGRGIALFPSSPQLHLSFLLACFDGDDDEEQQTTCMDVCRSSSRQLSSQAAASILLGADAGCYAEKVARYVAVMVATTALWIARTDASAAASFLTSFLAEKEVDGSTTILLLPVARQNLMLISMALRCGYHLHSLQQLPIGAISDLCYLLQTPVEILNADIQKQFSELDARNAAYHRDGFDRSLVDPLSTAASQSQSCCHSPFCIRAVEQRLRSAPPPPALAQSLLYSSYVAAAAMSHKVASAKNIAEALLETADTPLVLRLQLQFSCRVLSAAAAAAQRQSLQTFAELHHTSWTSLQSCKDFSQAVERQPNTPLVEWVAFFVLSSQMELANEAAAAQWTALTRLPLAPLLDDTAALFLLFAAQLRFSAEQGELEIFKAALETHLTVLRARHLQVWNSLDYSNRHLIGLPHYATLLVYRVVPLLLAQRSTDTMSWRCAVLETGARLGVLHPLLIDGER